MNNDLIPSVICWQSPVRLTFIIDGAHRLSALIAWLEDDYGAGKRSVEFYGKVPGEQERIHEKTRSLVKSRVGSYAEWRAELATPGSVSELSAKVRSLAHAKVPLLWVPGSDATKAEKAFFTINQKAVEIDATELKILNARSKPNAVAARTIVRNATGTKYWESFSPEGQTEVVKLARKIYAAMYSPPLQSPPRTEEIPVAGHGYGSHTLPLIFDMVNIANGLPVEDASKYKKRNLVAQGHAKPEEGETIETLKRTFKLVSRITTTDPSSLGMHPAVYFYSKNFRHQPTAVLAVSQFVHDMSEQDEFLDFTQHRGKFESFLVEHKMFINQLTFKHGSMAKGYREVRDYYRFVLQCIKQEFTVNEIVESLGTHEKYHQLIKDRPILSKKAKEFSQEAKNVKLMSDVLETAFVCNVCGARIDKKAMHLDHIVEKSKGGLATLENSQWLHPYCDSTAKRHL